MTKIYDGLLGLAVGDALGVPVEFCSRDYLKKNKVDDMMGYGSHNVAKGTWSDDTSLTIATLDSINEMGTVDCNDIMHKFAEWCCNYKYTATGVLFDIGISTSKSIKKYLNGVPPLKCGGTEIFDNGNGSLMRIFPVVCYCLDNGMDDLYSKKIINDVSSLTHSHSISKIACNIYYDFMKNLVYTNDPVESLNRIEKENYIKYYDSESLDKFDRIFSHSIFSLNEKDIKSGGYVVDTLEASIWSLLKTKNYQDAVLTAVNLGEDTDTVGAITGSMAGVLYGKENIPQKWIDDLINEKYLKLLTDKYKEIINSKKNKVK